MGALPDRDSRLTVAISPRLERGLTMLLEAHCYALELERDTWDFAVELACLKDLGLTRSDVSWLVCKGYVEHAREITQRHDDVRTFQPVKSLRYSKRSCFALTAAGVALAGEFIEHCDANLRGLAQSSVAEANCHPGRLDTPTWDIERHELRIGKQIVKSFKGPSPNQQTILAAFEEDGWPPRIDDPLPLAYDLEPKRRLQDTIKSLNRNQRTSLIRFTGDGTGQGICWQLTDSNLAVDGDG